MLGRTACDLFWMWRYLERSESTARLVDAGFRLTLTRSQNTKKEWMSVLSTLSCTEAYFERHDQIVTDKVVDFLIRDKTNPASIMSMQTRARENARRTRTALTLDLWEAINEAWIELKQICQRPISNAGIPEILALIRRQAAIVCGCMHGTLLRNDIYYFCEIGRLIERSDNTARILNAKYNTLVTTIASGGAPDANSQWDMLLRSLAAERAFYWAHEGESSADLIAHFLILNVEMPRSLAHSCRQLILQLQSINQHYGEDAPASYRLAKASDDRLRDLTIPAVKKLGLRTFLSGFMPNNAELARQIEIDYRFKA